MTRRRAALPAIAVLSGMLALTACTAPPGAAAPDDSEPPTSPTPSAEPVEAGPEARIPVDCDGLASTAALQLLVGETANPLAPVPAIDRLDPDDAAVTQLGGIDCQWTNGLGASTWTGPDADRQVVILRVLPDGLDGAIEYVDLYQSADPTYGTHVQGPRCMAATDASWTGFCELYGAIGPTWVEFTVHGIVFDGRADPDLLAGFRGVADPMVDALAATEPGPRWTPGESARAGACEDLAPATSVAAITGLAPIGFGESWDGPRVGQYFWAAHETGAMRCSIFFTDRDAGFGEVGVLPGGSWGFDRGEEAWLAGGAEVVQVAGVEPGDALLRCADPAAECTLDVRTGGDWVRVEFPEVPAATVEYLPPNDYSAARDSIVRLAETVVAGLRASDGA
ncbi:hypothetical protein FLP10_13435 [Agromyces intestinalis]|uniref:DUF3558 domain-containing protein n=1 Tax=Agromyces intestinalis TaxID=2592652 RepID=A0A5C1YJP8_9MICO|nr:hypothetical protein [Agromyces intestinalis]QEO15317.1 hypothetical protein FLP10_13435 [Agromyces intestinalis]